jgi:hypothetical protein
MTIASTSDCIWSLENQVSISDTKPFLASSKALLLDVVALERWSVLKVKRLRII